MRLILGHCDLVMEAGEVADFDTQVRHWVGSTGDEPAEVLSLSGRHGETAHLRSVAHPDQPT